MPKREGPPVAARGPSLSGRSHLLGRVGRKALFISEGLICLLADQSSGQPAADADFDTLADCKVLSFCIRGLFSYKESNTLLLRKRRSVRSRIRTSPDPGADSTRRQKANALNAARVRNGDS